MNSKEALAEAKLAVSKEGKKLNFVNKISPEDFKNFHKEKKTIYRRQQN